MGLEGVELILAVEEEFDIKISDGEVGQADTVGKLYQCVLDKIDVPANNQKHLKVTSKEEIWDKLTYIISEQLDIKREGIKPESNFARDLHI